MGVPRTHKEGHDKNKSGQRSLDEVHRVKKAAAEANPQADRSRENADRAKGNWSKTK